MSDTPIRPETDSTLPEPISGDIDGLVARMTLEEKAGQMTQLTLEAISREERPDELDEEKVNTALVDLVVGSVINVRHGALTLDRWRTTLRQLQRVATEKTRLGIPILYGVDSVHGANYTLGATIFPHNLGLACSWNRDLVARVGQITGRETLASSIPWSFAPVLDLGRQPLWSRFFETFGEDPFLCSELGRFMVEGIQEAGVAACCKHFVGYGVPVSGKDRTPAVITDMDMHDKHLRPFRSAIAAGAKSIMINSGVVNGEPVHSSYRLLTEVLRGQLGFTGVVVSDWEDVIKLHSVHCVASSVEEAVFLAIEAGIDMSMTPFDFSFPLHVVNLVKSGRLSETRVDQSVRRILALKRSLDLWATPLPGERLEIGVQASCDVSEEAARQSFVLLKNEDDILPLGDVERLLVTGPSADSPSALHGSWTYTWQGRDRDHYPEHVPTVLEALTSKFGDEIVRYRSGALWERLDDLDPTVTEAEHADAVVVCVGEEASVEKPGDIDDLDLPVAQIELVKRVASTGRPVILVVLQDRPRIIREIEPHCKAILVAHRPGPHGGNALADILRGDVNPSGKLPYTYPRSANDLMTHDHTRSEQLGRKYGTVPRIPLDAFTPQFRFGFGMSYSMFEYGGLGLDDKHLSMDDKLRLRVRVKNLSTRYTGTEVVQCYITDEYASSPPPVQELFGFQRVTLDPGEEIHVSFEIPVRKLARMRPNGRQTVEPGAFEVRIGTETTTFTVSSNKA